MSFDHTMIAPTVYECAWSGRYGVVNDSIHVEAVNGEIVECEHCGRKFLILPVGKRTHDGKTD